MTPLAFLRSAEVERACARAASAAGTPLSLHFVERGQEQLRVQGWGGCAACEYVAEAEGGKQACRMSRQTASGMAVRQVRAMPFVCHMGFGCLSVPALAGEGFVLTFGPYCPAEETKTLASDALAGLAALGEEGHTSFPVSLQDIHLAPVGVLGAVADMLTDALRGLWKTARGTDSELIASSGTSDPTDKSAQSDGVLRKRRAQPVSNPAPYAAAEIAAALAAGDQPRARILLAVELAEGAARGRSAAALRRARTVTAVSAALEAAERAALPTEDAWQRFQGLAQALESAEDEAACLDAAMAVLGIVRRRAAPRAAPKTTYSELNTLLKERLHEGVSLEDAARHLGQTPSAISKRLIRKFGMNYSEYIGRLRMEKAKHYLRRTQFDAAEVGRRVGIGDQSNFGKLFRKYEGMTPLEYRRRFGKKP